MSTQRLEQARAIVLEVGEHPPEDRDAMLDAACAGDIALRAEVERLISADSTSSEQPVCEGSDLHDLPTGGGDQTRIAPQNLPGGGRIGGYVIRRAIATGGMGTVYEAMQEHPRRTVAIKVVNRGMASRSAMRRFEYESQVLARLRHPGIAQIYEAGTYDDGGGSVPYFVMEYIPGARSITDYAQRKRLTTRERLELFVKVAEAVHHGHQKGIIHRDLKPANILADSHGQPKVIDFGVARATDADLAITTLQTDVGQLIGTVQYMSPEQVEADPHDIDTRSDVYALGIVLYELLCERLPYDVSNVAVFEATRMIREQTPTRISTVDSSLRGDVETIVLKALEKDPERRYQSADDLRQDILHYLHAEPISARPPSLIYQLRVLARRNRVLFIAVAAVVLMAVAAAIVSTTFAVKAVSNQKKAEDAHALANQKEEEARDEALNARAAELAATEAAKTALDAQRRAEFQAYIGLITSADMAIRLNDVVTAHARLDSTDADLRSADYNFLSSRLDQSVLTYPMSIAHFMCAAISADGRLVAVATSSGPDESTVTIYRAATGTAIQTLEFEGAHGVCTAVAFSHDDRSVAAAFGEFAATAFNPTLFQVRDVLTGDVLIDIPGTDRPITSIAYSADDSQFLTNQFMNTTIQQWGVARGHPMGEIEGHPATVAHLSINHDGSQIGVSGDLDPAAVVLDAVTGEIIHRFDEHGGAVSATTFSADGTLFATACADGKVRVYQTSDGALAHVMRGHQAAINAVAFNHDGTQLISGSDDRTVRIWDTASGDEVTTMLGHTNKVAMVAFSSDSTQCISVSRVGRVRVWDVGSTGATTRFAGHESWVECAAFTPDGAMVVSGSQDRTVRVWDAKTGQLASVLRGHEGAVTAIAVSPDGAVIATGSTDRTVKIWPLTRGAAVIDLLGHGGHITDLAFSHDGGQLATACSDGFVRLFDAQDSYGELHQLEHGDREVMTVALSPDGSMIAAGGSDGVIRIWEAGSLTLLHTLTGHDGAVHSVAFNQDGSLLASGAADRTVRLWDALAGEQRYELAGHSAQVNAVKFSAFGDRIISASNDHTLKVWDTHWGQLMLTIAGHGDAVTDLDFSPVAQRLVSASWDRSLLIWETTPYSSRSQVIREARRRRVQANVIVDELLQQEGDIDAVIRRLQNDLRLDDAMREVAIQQAGLRRKAE